MKIGCVILAGGKSSRMGEDKALLEIGGKYFIEKIAEEFSFFEEKIIARGNNNILTGREVGLWKQLPDQYKDHGPLGGLHAALKACESEVMFCVSCDMPLITKNLAEKMCGEMKEAFWDAVIAVTDNGKYHPLCGVYHKELWKSMEEHILQDNNRLMAVLGKCRVKYVNLDKEESKQLMNVNTRSEYEKL